LGCEHVSIEAPAGFVFAQLIVRPINANSAKRTLTNRWPAVHRLDAAKLYRLALERGVEKGAGGARYNAVAEEDVPLRAIAEAIGRGLKVPVVSVCPEEAGEHFGWLADFVGFDLPVSSALRRNGLDGDQQVPGSLPI
jgi:nucleoside-diphosphate-sugar epimerase